MNELIKTLKMVAYVLTISVFPDEHQLPMISAFLWSIEKVDETRP